ncbi:hypothetical protein FEE95_01280 [Maribacter algarum]|uniref:Uncharacterized protein n=1 Tax=Maribacter algarum (ex Zhang et al. 2020) TaxID=2578118 RepID=A0A5S3PXT4_9FLAO|nr:hypothetical protein [Maribacter algarum]TMM58087.1 hypothetical protein FEE95_01280 [Maribacter algarum]
MKYKTLFIFLFYVILLQAQKEKLTVKDYGFQITEMGIPKRAPSGYESILTVKLNKPLYPKKAYEVGFWIIGRQLRNQGYSYPINIFPSNFMGPVNGQVFDQVESIEILPALKVLPPPSYSGRGHFTFVIRPDTIYNYITIALKNSDWGRSPINFSKDVTVTGVFVRPFTEKQKEEDKIIENNERIIIPEETLPNKIAERVLIDSKKSYSISERIISIGLYDHRNIDKDRVTIYHNDKIVVQNLELKRKKKMFEIRLEPGANRITLHAKNLGEVAPNTAAILIKTKTQEYEAVLASDLGQSQYFTLIYKQNK